MKLMGLQTNDFQPTPGLSAPRKLISILVPTFNEESNVLRLYHEVDSVSRDLRNRYDFEIVFTDNHSTDQTFALIQSLAAKDSRVRGIRFSKNFGYQLSILTGYKTARGDAAIQLDCDLQDPPRLIPDFLRKWEEGHAVVYGIRASRQESLLMRGTRKLFYRSLSLLSSESIPVDVGDFRLVDRKVLHELRKIKDPRPYLRGTIATMGFNQVGIPYQRDRRKSGESKFPLRSLFRLGFDGILNHSHVPLRFASFFGLFMWALTFAGIIIYFIGRIFGTGWPAGFATIVILILLSISVNSLFLGIIGEYVGRIYQAMKLANEPIVEDQTHVRDH